MPSWDTHTTPKSRIVSAIEKLRRNSDVVVVQRHNDGTITAQTITTKPASPTTVVGLAQFDNKLTDIVTGIKQEKKMSNITGAGFLGNQFKTALAGVKAKLNKAGSDLSTAVGELNDKADQASAIVKQVEAETADLTATLGQLSNGGPE